MNLKSVVRGVGVGTAVGTACYLLSKATSRQKNANKAMKAVGCVLDDIGSLMF